MFDGVFVDNETEGASGDEQQKVHKRRAVSVATVTVERRQVPSAVAPASRLVILRTFTGGCQRPPEAAAESPPSRWNIPPAAASAHAAGSHSPLAVAGSMCNLNSRLSVVVPGGHHFAFHKIPNPYSLHAWVRVCRRSQDRLYLAAGDGLAFLPPEAAAISNVNILL